jgi:hypothetical protein
VATAQVETLRARVLQPWYSCGFRDDHEATCETMRHRGFPDLAMPELTSPFANAGFIVYRPFDAEVQELLRTWRRVYDLGYAKKVSVDQPALWVAQHNTPNLRIQVLDVTMSCRVHDSFSQCGRFSARPANFVTEHTRRAKNCVLIHGHNLSAARHPITG